MSDEAKVRFLFRKVQHTGLHSSIDALKSSQTTGMTISYTIVANHLSTATYELPEYISNNARNVSVVQVGDWAKGGYVIYNEDGSINNGHIPNWKTLTFKDQKNVIDERKWLSITYKGKSGAKCWGRVNSNHATAYFNRFKPLKEQNQKLKSRSKSWRDQK